MSFNFNDAEPQKTGFGEPIPDGTIAIVVASLRAGGHGQGNWLKNTKNGDALMADFEFTVDGGQFDRRKFWGNYITEGETEGHQKAAAISRSLMRAMLESAFGVDPGDESPAAQERRQVPGWEAFDGLRFVARIGIEKGGLKDKMAGLDSERYADKNVLREAVTPDNPKYVDLGGAPTPRAAAPRSAPAAGAKPTASAKGASKPAWAS